MCMRPPLSQTGYTAQCQDYPVPGRNCRASFGGWTMHGLVAVGLVSWAIAQPPPAPRAPRAVGLALRAVEQVTLKNGTRLIGLITSPDTAGEVTLVADREWLRRHAPREFAQATLGDAERGGAILAEQRARLEAWHKSRAEWEALAAHLQSELAAIVEREARWKKQPEPPSQLVLVRVPQLKIRRVFRKPAADRRLAAAAWELKLSDVENRGASSLLAEVREHGVKLDTHQPDLSDRFGLLAQTDEQWQARKALVEYKFLREPAFQGMGAVLVRVGARGQAADLAQLVPELIQERLQGQLAELLGGSQGQQSAEHQQTAIKKALADLPAEEFTGCQITVLDHDAGLRQVRVTGWFFVRFSEGAWREIWQTAITADPANVSPERLEDLKADPQIQGIEKVFDGLGLGGSGDVLETALRFGAATQEAQLAVDKAFGEYLSESTRALVGYPVWVPPSPLP